MDPMDADPGGGRFDLRALQPWNDPERVTENERLLGGLCYASQILIPLLFPVIVLLTQEGKRSNYVRYHAMHSLALLAVAIVYDLIALFAFLLVTVIMGCLACVAWVLFVPPLIALAYYGWQAFAGRAPVIPWVSDVLQKNNLL
jgi:uncharacterized membrane protein